METPFQISVGDGELSYFSVHVDSGKERGKGIDVVMPVRGKRTSVS